jgi:hypothetical protein
VAIVNNVNRQCKKTDASRTRINNVVAGIGDNWKPAWLADQTNGLDNEEKKEKLKELVALGKAESVKVVRALNLMREWQDKYARLIDDLEDGQEEAEEAMEQLINEEQIAQTENRALDLVDLIIGIKEMIQVLQPPPADAGHGAGAGAGAAAVVAPHIAVQLPKMELPEYMETLISGLPGGPVMSILIIGQIWHQARNLIIRLNT